MASDKIIHGRINMELVKEAWLYKGEKGKYLDFTMFYNEEQDQYKTNGMIVQSVPNSVFKAEKDLPKEQRSKGAILGNCKEFKAVNSREESTPGYSGGNGTATKEKTTTAAAAEQVESNDDLPF